MDSWRIEGAAPRGPACAQRSLGGLIGVIGDDDFAARALASLNDSLQAASWSVYEVPAAGEPVLHLSASRGVVDTTGECFRVYRESLHQSDRSFAPVREAPGQAVVLRMGADEVPNAAHRDAIYRRHRVVERLSVARQRQDGSLLAVNLYHHEHQGRFEPGEIEGFAQIAPAVLAGVGRHIELDAARAAPPRSQREALAQRCAALTVRELDICERLLGGLSYDGIAADLALSVATVKTYRRRAFERLGIHFKSELFALALRQG
jgi:DNA-binding NarL/FixJ family response regulator